MLSRLTYFTLWIKKEKAQTHWVPLTQRTSIKFPPHLAANVSDVARDLSLDPRLFCLLAYQIALLSIVFPLQQYQRHFTSSVFEFYVWGVIKQFWTFFFLASTSKFSGKISKCCCKFMFVLLKWSVRQSDHDPNARTLFLRAPLPHRWCLPDNNHVPHWSPAQVSISLPHARHVGGRS